MIRFVQTTEYLRLHTWIPIASEMIGGRRRGGVFATGGEIQRDLVGHIDQMLRRITHLRSYSAAGAAMRRVRRATSS